ncbi:MAG: aminoglycoside phosphotransferase family protein [Trueperaceae bacterium]|nr:aminoglycoside phosphotransferase family protein [Trueperaceae bacterium]
MPLPTDLELIRRDTELPGLGLLLDAEVMLAHFQKAFPERGYSDLQILYVRYKPQTSCLVRLELETSGGLEQAYASAYQTDNHDKFSKAELAPEQLCKVLRAEGLVLQRFPYDRNLKHLAELLDPLMRSGLLKKALGQAMGDSQLKPLVYKPERRFVAKLETKSTSFALKQYSSQSFDQALASAKALEALDLPIAKLQGSSEKHKLIAFDWLNGKTLRELFLENQACPDTLYSLGQTLAKVHMQDASSFPSRSRTFEKERLIALNHYVGWLLPNLGSQLSQLTSFLSKEFSRAAPCHNLVHGDFYDKQVLVNEDEISLIDFDDAYRGDPAHDIGLFTAHLERNLLIGRLSERQCKMSLPAFLEGYKSLRPLPERIDLYTAAELIGLAPHFFRNREPDWAQQTEDLLARASEIVVESYVVSA